MLSKKWTVCILGSTHSYQACINKIESFFNGDCRSYVRNSTSAVRLYNCRERALSLSPHHFAGWLRQLLQSEWIRQR
ncbi:hypothetical protein AB6A40_000269 [Gnathostoma spinigerum]|uniref:Uncharacterized protein n=1 Tax=Gnathostoma spinigerum TaxID=75299 RepID=A0ABD6EB91_9BILA